MKPEEKEEIRGLLNGVQDILHEIMISGLALANETLLSRIDMVFHQATVLNCYRISTALRYQKNEIRNFIQNSPKFSIERLVFFTSQIWLLYKAIAKLIEQDEVDMEQKEVLFGDHQTGIPIDEMTVHLVGLELHNIQNSILGFTFYFLVLDGAYKGEILSWDYIKQNRGMYNIEPYLMVEFNDIPFKLTKLFYNEFKLQNIQLNHSNGKIKITFDPEKAKRKDPDQSGFDVCSAQQYFKDRKPNDFTKKFCDELNQYFDKFEFSEIEIPPAFDLLQSKFLMEEPKKQYNQISAYDIQPIDTIFDFKEYILLKNITVKELPSADDDQKKKWQGEILTETNVKFIVQLDDKPTNENLIQFLKKSQTNKDVIDYLFGYYYLNKGKMIFKPLSAIMQEYEIFLALSADAHKSIINKNIMITK